MNPDSLYSSIYTAQPAPVAQKPKNAAAAPATSAANAETVVLAPTVTRREFEVLTISATTSYRFLMSLQVEVVRDEHGSIGLGLQKIGNAIKVTGMLVGVNKIIEFILLRSRMTS